MSADQLRPEAGQWKSFHVLLTPRSVIFRIHLAGKVAVKWNGQTSLGEASVARNSCP